MADLGTIIPSNVGAKSRVVLPSEVREALGLKENSQVLFCVQGDEVRITTRRNLIRRAQQNIKRYIPAGISLADELSAERREAAKHE